RLAGIRAVVLRSGDDVVVAAERPEAAAVRLVLPVKRRVTAEHGEPLVRDALDPALEVGEVDLIEAHAFDRRPPPGGGARYGLRPDGAVGRREADLERALVRANLVDRQRLEGGRREDVAGVEVELRAVAGTDDDVPVEVAARERALLVRAGAVEGDPLACHAA